ncbi:LysM peptidoglycan-binding domain-containing protein [Lachnospiraceae bacterium OttesenSCG-928-E19]|nr:LysM peptidoglycan-binding domain-containing protein [Lachnospiraceae bacterium OttesenSCG-928-E19]
MAKKNIRTSNIGKTKRSTDSMIDDAIAQQNAWLENRRSFARRFLKKLNVFAKPNPKNEEVPAKKQTKLKPAVKSVKSDNDKKQRAVLKAYWFPILCALLVIFIAIWVGIVRLTTAPSSTIVVTPVPEPSITAVVDENLLPSFDLVRVQQPTDKNPGNVVIAGRWLPHSAVSVLVNKKVVATERTNSRGEFAYAPSKVFKPGNYTISLLGVDKDVASEDNVFVYISEHGYKNSISLLMTRDGSTLLQAPTLVDGDLTVSKIDYLENGRIVVTGNALPRLRVSLSLNDKYLGFARVSDHKHFGLGADVNALEPGKEYKLEVRLHDGNGVTVSKFTHEFVMPEMTGDDNTFYTVRRGDCLWIIARNFLRRGILFSIIAERNAIENPDLIYPKQLLQIPIEK